MKKTANNRLMPERPEEMGKAIEHNTKIDAEEDQKLNPKERIIKTIEKAKKKREEQKDEQNLSSFIFDESEREKKLHSAIDYHNKTFHYGVLIPKKCYDEKTDKPYLKDKLIFITNDQEKNFVDPTKPWQQDNNVKISKSPFQIGINWSLPSVKLYLEKRENPIEGQELFNDMQQMYYCYSYKNDERFYDIDPLWDMHTYSHVLFDATPYKEEQGLKGTGKTKDMTISSLMSFNGVIITNPRPSPIFRYVERNRATLYCDETEFLSKEKSHKRSEEYDELITLFNSGWQKGALIPRSKKNDNNDFDVELFDSFGPKRFGSIRGLSGPLQDRSITEIHTKPPLEDNRGELWPKDGPAFQRIRDRCHIFTLQNAEKISELNQNWINEFKISNRDLLKWKPLLIIAKIISEDLYKRIGAYAEDISSSTDDQNYESDTWEYKALNGMRILLERPDNDELPVKITIKEIKENMGLEEKEKHCSNDWIGRFICRIGFKKFKKKVGNMGVYYFLSLKDYCELLKNQGIVVAQDALSIRKEEIIDDTSLGN